MLLSEKALAAEEIFTLNADLKTILDEGDVDANFLLYEASKRGCISHMETLVKDHGADVNALSDTKPNEDDPMHMAPPLLAAVYGFSVSAVEWLLKAGANPNAQCFLEDCIVTPFFMAAEYGNVRIAKLLLDHGADVNVAKSTNGNTPLFMAVQNQHLAVVSLLLSFGADPNQKKDSYNTYSPLQAAIGRGNPRLIAQLINAGAGVSIGEIVFLNRIQQTKKTNDQCDKTISDKELEQIKDLLSIKPFLVNNKSYEKAKGLEKAMKYRPALRVLKNLSSEHPCTQLSLDMDRMIDAIYGVRGSDNTISIWKSVPLMTQTEPTHYQDYAWTQLGRKIYRHGGMDKTGVIEQRDELWELDIDTRIWVLLKTAGKSPGCRTGHTMWSWKNALYVWGGRTSNGDLDAKLYRLIYHKNGPLCWEVVKTGMKPPGRDYHAGVLYKDKYYITGGNSNSIGYDLSKEFWQFNMTNNKWTKLKDGPVERYCHGMWAANGKVYVLGGRRLRELSPSQLASYSIDSFVSYDTSYSIESFVSYDIEAKMWSHEPIIGDRPFDLSEFTVLPLYKDLEDVDPSSIIIWGGYHEFDRANAFLLYGEEWREFDNLYLSRLLRFYPDTMVFKKLKPTTRVLPKAQSFAAEIRTENNSLEMLVGGGYGFTAESIVEAERRTEESPEELTPRSSNEVFSVFTGQPGDSWAKDMVEGRSWACKFCDLAQNTMPQFSVDYAPCSPVLHNGIDFTYEDFQEPPCNLVKPNDDKTLLGVRVELTGLIRRSDLNGKIGRILGWIKNEERYEVFIPTYAGGPLSISVKSNNLKVAEIPCLEGDNFDELIVKSTLPKRYPLVNFVLRMSHDTAKIKRPIFDQLVNPPKLSGAESFDGSDIFDQYSGPVSRRAKAIVQRIAIPKSMMNKSLPDYVRLQGHACLLIPDSSQMITPYREQMVEHLNLYSEFVNTLKEKDITRVNTFERKIANLKESKVSKKCGKWLRLVVAVDGLSPTTWRELLVNPDTSMQSLHNQVLCPVLGWTNYNHCYAFRRTGMLFYTSDDHDCSLPRKKSDHETAMKFMHKEVWIGPKKSNAIDTMFLPLFIGGCMTDDRNITLGQLFALNDNIEEGKLFLQWVHDIGDWWSHSICVTKYNIDDHKSKVPENATVAHLLRGKGGSIPEDSGGLQLYYQDLLQLTGKIALVEFSPDDSMTYIDPGSEQWWSLFNKNFRSRSNRGNFLSYPNVFDFHQASNRLNTEIHRPRPKNINENAAWQVSHLQSRLDFSDGKKCTIAAPRKATDTCAYCGVTIALKRCSACEMVSYCSKEHATLNWPNHKADCKRVRNNRK